ncbi:MAG: xylulokinase [Clostridiales bacterium]|jgi:xylulokinase|nr:xylulokinase [Clostridiales bacterium]
MGFLLGIDIGTSGTKAVLYDESGVPRAKKTVEYPLSQPQNGWAEQNPDDWWRAAVEGIKFVLETSGVPSAGVAGIGLSGQMHGLVMLDKDGKVLRPSIIWCDQRTAKECEQINRALGAENVIAITANPPMTGFTASKILWVRNNEPEVYEKCAHILLPKDYIRYRLTGEFATEVSDASGMQLMDISRRTWSATVLEKLCIDKALLPSMHESPDITGRVQASAAKETGLAKGTLVVGGAGDNAAAAVGTGVVREGRAFTTIGSSAVVYAVSDNVRIDGKGRVHGLCASVPGKWTVMSCTQGAGLSLKWLRDTVCVPEIGQADRHGVNPYDVMGEMAERIPIGAERLIFLPYLMGERSPHPDPNCRGVFFGLSAMHQRAHLIRAVMEGVAFSQGECVEVFRETGVPVSDMVITGGGGRSALWRQMLADIYNCPVNTLSSEESGTLGAAMLAGVGAGIFSGVEQAADAIVKKENTVLPNGDAAAAYMPYYRLYQKLYRALKAGFDELAVI